MQIHDKYIIYSLTKTEAGKEPSKKIKPTPGMLQRATLDVLSFYGDAGKTFSPVSSDSSSAKLPQPIGSRKAWKTSPEAQKTPDKLDAVDTKLPQPIGSRKAWKTPPDAQKTPDKLDTADTKLPQPIGSRKAWKTPPEAQKTPDKLDTADTKSPQPIGSRKAWKTSPEAQKAPDKLDAVDTKSPQPIGDKKVSKTPPEAQKTPDKLNVVEKNEAKKIVRSRKGEVLKKGLIIKEDQFSTLHNDKLQTKTHGNQPKIEGAPNFRKVKGDPIYGTGQPTIEGIKQVLKETGADPGGSSKKAIWTNMREESVIYINGRPHNLRKMNKWYSNMEKTGISGEDVEKTEQKLKQEILKEAKANGGKILLHEEDKDGNVKARWVKVDESGVKTTKEVFDDLKKQGYNVDYKRIPVSDEKRPEAKDVDEVVNRLKDVDPDSPLIFNCHAGRGRTTTATVIAGLMKKARDKNLPDKKITKYSSVKDDIRENTKYDRGEYKVILSLCRVLEQGPESKEEVDKLIDKYDSLQNLRTAINEKKIKSEDPKRSKGSRKSQVKKGKEYLERYSYLIMFNSYLKEQSPGFKKSFENWVKDNPQFDKKLKNIELAMGFKSPAESGGGEMYA